MFPPEVWLRAEDSILEQLASQAREMLAQFKTDGVVGDDVVLQAATGNGWDDAIDAADWLEGDLLGIGTSPVGGIATCSSRCQPSPVATTVTSGT